MKIGCCLAYYKNHNNYGTSLQGYATVKVLQNLGHEVRIVRYKKCDSLMRRISIAPFQLMSGGYKAYIRRMKKKQKSRGQMAMLKIRTEANNRFKDKMMEPLCDEYVGYGALRRGSLNYDAVLVGSDQVWTPLGLYSRFYNLMFVDDSVRKISYASSFGVSVIPWFQHRATGAYLDRIDYLSVREIKAKELVDTLSHRKAKVVCDPTLLRTKEEWMDEIGNRKLPVDDEYIFCYLLGGNIETRRVITQFAKERNIKIVTLRHTDEYLECDECFGDVGLYDVDPIDFIHLISKARYVCTDSFHGSVFSIIFNKQFVTFYRFNSQSANSRNSRIDSLFALFGLQDRLFSGELDKQINADIDYKSVNKKVSALRNDSLAFLNDALR